MPFRKLAVATFLFALTPAAFSQQDVYVPEELEPWREWVLEGKEYRNCPFFFNMTSGAEDAFACAWPGRLVLDLDGSGGTFSQSWTVYEAAQWVWLPGGVDNWPQSVQADGRPLEVVWRENVPAVRLEPGSYQLSGRFSWSERPGRLPVPRQSGLIDLNLDGESIERPEREGRFVWLGEPDTEREVQDALRAQVYRLIQDEIPTRIGTVFEIDVSGSVREELIGPALPDGYTPLLLESDLPARVEPDGNLRLQVRPGVWEVILVARAPGVEESVTLATPGPNMPDVEIWSYHSEDELRVTVAEGLAPVDPLQVAVPPDWEELPAFRVTPGDTLTIVERSDLTFVAPPRKTPKGKLKGKRKEYTGPDFSEMLRKKWELLGKDINDLDTFIEEIASDAFVSMTPYLVVYRDGREEPFRGWLLEQLETRRQALAKGGAP